MVLKKHILLFTVFAVVVISSCIKLPTPDTTVQRLCPTGNPVYVVSRDNDSAMYWIPNCFAPGDSTSPNDSLVEFERNIAQAIVTITDSANNIIAYDLHNFAGTGFNSHKVWNGNYLNTKAAEKCYLLQVRGTTLFGTSFNLTGTVSLLRYFFGNDTAGVRGTRQVLVKCDSCFFNSQWSGSNFNPQLPNHENFIEDTVHHCN